MEELNKKMSELFGENISLDNIYKTQKLKQTYFPSQLFKYRPCSSRAIQNLREGSLFCATADTFNDPYDCALTFTLKRSLILESEIQELTSHILGVHIEKIDAIKEFVLQRNKKLNAELVASFNKSIQSMYKICSLSARLDSLLMWGHYGGMHSGFAMEYDFKSLPEDHVMGLSLWPVFYSDSLYDASHIMDLGQDTPLKNNMVAIISAMHKARDWAYEKEWRIIIVEGPESPNRSFKAPLKAVHMGSKITPDNEDTITSIARDLNIAVTKMKLSDDRFRMEAQNVFTP